MKKFSGLFKPYLDIIFGVLLVLASLNSFSDGGETLAFGIIATIIGIDFVTIGIISLVLRDKLSKGAKAMQEVFAVSSYVLFTGVASLIALIKGADVIGPTGWVIAIFTIVVSFVLAVILVIAYFIKLKELNTVVILFGGFFILIMILNILFNENGNATTLGQVVILNIILYLSFGAILFLILEYLANIGKEDEEGEIENIE